MLADIPGERQQRQRLLVIDAVGGPALRQARALGLLAFPALHIGAKPTVAQRDFFSRVRVLAEDFRTVLTATCLAVALLAELAGEAAFGIVRAADECAVFAELEREVACSAFRADARIGAVFPRRKRQRGQFLVQGIQHIGDAQFLDVVYRSREIAPEIAQHVLPGELAVGNLVELFLERRREIIFDILLEEAFEEGRNQPAFGMWHQPAFVDRDVFTVFQRLQRRSVGRGPADAELLHLLDQRRLGIARRRLGRVLRGVDRLARQHFAGTDFG